MTVTKPQISRNKQRSSEQTAPSENARLFVSLAQERKHQSILIEVLKTALEPNPLEKKIDLILDYLLAQPHLQFGAKAAMFYVEQASKTLTQMVSRGFPQPEMIACREIRFGLCHCGQVVKSGKLAFFNTPPLLLHISASPQPYAGNYCVPIIKDGQSLGIFTIYVNKNHRSSPEIVRLLGAVGNIFAVMVDSRQMDQQLIQLVNDLRESIISLREEKKFSESIIQGLHHGLLVVDLDGKIRTSNSVAQSIFKPFTEVVDGRYIVDFLGKEAARQVMSIVPSESNQLDRELSLITPNGEKKILGFSNVCREDAAGRTVGVIISLADISKLKYVRKEMEKMNRLATIAEIASAVAHEVRNPLAGIKIMAQSIEEEAKDNSDQRECAQRIARQVDRLNILLSDFFSYARPAEPNKQPTSLAAILFETKPLINSRLTKNHIELHEDISNDLPKIIADPHQLQQVFLNLFLNAIDAIKQRGRIDIIAHFPTRTRLRQYRKDYPALLENSPYIVVDFSDNGTGMSPSTTEKVFEPFFTTKTSGAGLGLSIVYRTLKENNAAIVLTSKEGKGTTFTIFLKADV